MFSGSPRIVVGEDFGIGAPSRSSVVQSTLSATSSSSSQAAASSEAAAPPTSSTARYMDRSFDTISEGPAPPHPCTALYIDRSFDATIESIEGAAEVVRAARAASRAASGPPRCRCGADATRLLVEKQNRNHGRPFWTCAEEEVERKCKFFKWGDVDASRSKAHAFVWRRFPECVLVSDNGFRAQDLRQGGLGDCWFLSALAVVAERHDLIARLFVDLDAKAVAAPGRCAVRLFLDGAWRVVEVDDRLPCVVKGATVRRAAHAGASRLAYSRAAGNQLWVQLLEKAYAKAHGSYQAISGGQIAEALLALTGAPSFTIDFSDPAFDMRLLWSRLVYFARCGFPMGCATAADHPQLRAVGLVGQHAYSILDCRTVHQKRSADGGGGPVHLIRVRNPHGVGEWSGDWGDASAKWKDLVAASGDPALERTWENDGTWWIDLTHFVMAFELVEVSMAHRAHVGWSSASFANVFCAKSSRTRLCAAMYRVVLHPTAAGTGAHVLFATALQPAARGSNRGRSDRKKSYKLGDICIVLCRVKRTRERRRRCGSGNGSSSAAGDEIDAVLGFGLNR